jgi:hypothetical protein
MKSIKPPISWLCECATRLAITLALPDAMYMNPPAMPAVELTMLESVTTILPQSNVLAAPPRRELDMKIEHR